VIGVNGSQIAVNLASVAQVDYQDNQPAVIDRVDHLVSAHRLVRAPVLASPISSSVVVVVVDIVGEHVPHRGQDGVGHGSARVGYGLFATYEQTRVSE
jgi:hypothetical protein